MFYIAQSWATYHAVVCTVSLSQRYFKVINDKGTQNLGWEKFLLPFPTNAYN
jgi:hypothetical protein